MSVFKNVLDRAYELGYAGNSSCNTFYTLKLEFKNSGIDFKSADFLVDGSVADAWFEGYADFKQECGN